MKKRHIIRTLSVCVALLLLSACRQEQDGLAVADESAALVQVSFTLTTASGNASTRVGTDEPGTGYENYIDITNNNFRFLLFDKDNNTFVYSFTPQSVTPAGASGEYAQTYEVEGEMPEEYADFNYKVVVLANWPTYPSENDLTGKTIQDICLAYTYNYTDSFVPSESQLIPFYGVATISTTLRPDISTNLGTIDLLRALCKVEVKCSANGFTLTGATLHRYSTQGMCAPLDVYNNTENWEGKEQIHLPATDVESEGCLDFTKQDDGSFLIYVPEYDNTNTGNEPSYLSVTLKDANNKEVTLKSPNIYFKDYTDGNPEEGSDYDLIRNHWYRFDITDVNDSKLIVQYRALPWELVESSIGYAPEPASTTVNPFDHDNDYDEFMKNGYILLPVDEFKNNEVNNVQYDRTTVRKLFKFLYDYPADRGDDDARYCILTKPTYVDADRKILKKGTAGARYFFMLTGPEGATWEAHLSNYEDEGGDFTFSYSESNDFNGCKDEGYTGKVKMVSHGIARPKPYIIQVNCVRSWTGTDETAATDENDKAIGEYPWYEKEGNNYWDDANNESRVDDIDDDGKNSWWEKDNRRNNFYKEYDQELRDAFTYYTAWGRYNNERHRVIATKLYITVTLADGTKYNLNINPSYKNHQNLDNMEFLYGDDERNWRRYAGEDDFIWIRQVPAQFDWSFEELARDVDESETGDNTWDNYQWWRENPYWKKKEVN